MPAPPTGYRNRAVAPVTIAVDSGPLFSLRSIRVLGPDGAELSEAELPARIVRLKPGDSAAAADLRAAEARIVDYFRKEGRPLAKIASVAPVVDHAAHVMDVTFTADPGPIAPFGEATMNGPKAFDPRIARSFLYIEPGDPYSPRAIEDARNSIREIPAVGGVTITEGTALDAYGRLPYTVDVEDRLPYAIGASAKYSTTNGPAGQVYWEDRNVFGGAERLRLQADVFYAPPWYVTSQDIRNFSIDDLGYRFSASFLKPALWGTQNDLLIDALGERTSTSGAGFFGYEVEDADATAVLRHRFSQNFWLQAGIEAQTGVATDALGRVNYTLVGVPVSANYDTTDSKLDPTRGVRLTGSVSRISDRPRLDRRYRPGQGARVRLLRDRPRFALRARGPRRGRRNGRRRRSRTSPPTGVSTPAAAARCAATPTTASGLTARSAP